MQILKVSSLVLVAIALAIQLAHSDEPRKDFDNMGGEPDTTDIMKETKDLSLNTEKPVPQTIDKSSSLIFVAAGAMSLNSLQTNTNGIGVNYNLGRALPLISVGYEYFPESQHRKWGNMGIEVGFGYSYSEYDQAQSTTLHLVPIDLALAYRYEKSPDQAWVPFAKAGPSEWIWIQRGVDELNNSAAVFGGEVAAGMSFKLKKIGLSGGPRDNPEVFLEVRRDIFGGGNNNFNGTGLQLGGTFAL